MLPDIALSMSASVGCGLLARSCEAEMLAVAALHDLPLEPGFLDLGARHCPADDLDRGDLGVAYTVDGSDAGPGGDPVDVYGAGSAQRHPAAELRAGHAQHVPQHPEQRDIDIEAVIIFVDLDREDHNVLSFSQLSSDTGFAAISPSGSRCQGRRRSANTDFVRSLRLILFAAAASLFSTSSECGGV